MENLTFRLDVELNEDTKLITIETEDDYKVLTEKELNNTKENEIREALRLLLSKLEL